MKKVDIVNNKRVCVLIALVVMVFVVFVGFCGFGGRGCGFFGGFGDSRGVGEVVFPVVSPVPAGFDVGRVSNIVFTADSGYVDYLRVALRSVLDNRAEGSYYNIYVLGVDLSDEDRRVLEGYSGGRVRVSLVPLSLRMLDKVGNYGIIGRRHVSRADLFKFFIPQIFKDLDRVLYLDSDIIVLGDLSKVYNYNLEGRLVGVVQESYTDKEFQYNCGVILFDIKKCNKEKITQKLIETKNKDKKHLYITQPFFHQILNEKKVQTMPLEFNRFAVDTQKDFEKLNYKKIYYKNDSSINSLEDVDKRAVIIHFLAYKKPWQYTTIPFADIWWHYARKVNPNWKPKKERNLLENTLLSIELSIGANRERKFKSFKDALNNFRENFKLIEEGK